MYFSHDVPKSMSHLKKFVSLCDTFQDYKYQIWNDFFSSEMILMDQIFGEDFSCTIEDLAS